MGSGIDDFLREDGTFEEAQDEAIKGSSRGNSQRP